jgi:hypothetical protein
MGLRQMFQQRKERRKVRSAFGDYLSPEVIRRLLAKPNLVEPQVKHFQFVVVLFDEPDMHQVSDLMGCVMRTLFEHKATVTSLSPYYLVGLLGVPFGEGNSPEVRRDVVEALLKENGVRIRIAHGECDALFGNLGSRLRFCYDAAIPGFLGILKKLLDAEPGSAFEVS